MSTHTIIVAGLGFGDEGKGSIVDFLARRHQAEIVVRYNGGAQAAHNVVDKQGRHHCFAQFGSGTLAGAKTFLSRYMLVNPIFMLPEAKHLETLGVTDPLSRVFVDRNALVTTPYHVSANRLREISRGDARHGSCGMGIGETVEHAIICPDEALRVGDLADEVETRGKLYAQQQRIWFNCKKLLEASHQPYAEKINREVSVLFADRYSLAGTYSKWTKQVHIVDGDWLANAIRSGTTIFEGAQGVLLDENCGFAPHTTWSNCTFENAMSLLDEADFKGSRQRLGVARAYHTRHGAGPFPTERIGVLSGEHNGLGEWQGSFRIGHLDLPLLQYATRACDGIDAIVLTCLDHLTEEVEVCDQYADDLLLPLQPMPIETQERIGKMLKAAKPILQTCKAADIPKLVSEWCKAPIAIISRGPTATDKQEL